MTPDEIKAKLAEQAAEQAPPVVSPEAFIGDAVTEVRESAKSVAEVSKTEAQVLAEGSESEFWTVIKRRMQARIRAMRDSQSTRLSKPNISLQDIGLRLLIVNEIDDAFSDIISTVEFTKRKNRVQVNSVDEDLPETLNEGVND